MRDRIRALARQQGLTPLQEEAWLDLFLDPGTPRVPDTNTFTAEPTVEIPLDTAETPEQRYVDLGRLALGGMGDVRRVHDRVLDRELAMKVLRDDVHDPLAEARFLAEARATAKLQHPGTVPAHDVGTLPDGRPYFTMQEVRGQTLSSLIKALHARAGTGWSTPGGQTLHGLVRAIHRVAQTVAYAHDAGVLHRDLKPANVMVGDFGEVIVVDWGLATDFAPAQTLPGVRRTRDPTQPGPLAGTPAYMAPEVARGDADALTPRVDVYALGALLYELLTGRRPYHPVAERTLDAVRAGPPPPIAEAAPHGRPLPPGLIRIAEACMARAAEDRPEDAGAVATALGEWLDGVARRLRAQQLVDRAAGAGPRVAALRDEAAALRRRASALLDAIPDPAPEADKAPAWALEDRAAALDAEAVRVDLGAEALYRAALADAPDLHAAVAALARRARAAHAAAEAERDGEGTLRAAVRLEGLLAMLPADHPDARDHRTWLAGTGRLVLRAEPPAAARLFRYVLRNRRLVAEPVRDLGTTPIDAPVAHGSWLVELTAPGCHPARYPVSLGRCEVHAPDAPVRLLPVGALGPDDCFVPAGPFWSGGDPDALDSLPGRRLWCPSFVMRRFPVTNREYIAFLEDLVARGQTDAALAHAPRERVGTTGGVGALIYGFDGERFTLQPDVDGDLWQPDWAVVMVDRAGALAYAAWEAARTGQPWRLPSELEWEKAGRGADGRAFPWGDWLDPSWACIKRSHVGPSQPPAVTDFAVDQSPYGVRGLAGGTKDWCADGYRPDGPLTDGDRVVVRPPGPGLAVERGGTWLGEDRKARLANRARIPPTLRYSLLGFRLCRSVAP